MKQKHISAGLVFCCMKFSMGFSMQGNECTIYIVPPPSGMKGCVERKQDFLCIWGTGQPAGECGSGLRFPSAWSWCHHPQLYPLSGTEAISSQ